MELTEIQSIDYE